MSTHHCLISRGHQTPIHKIYMKLKRNAETCRKHLGIQLLYNVLYNYTTSVDNTSHSQLPCAVPLPPAVLSADPGSAQRARRGLVAAWWGRGVWDKKSHNYLTLHNYTYTVQVHVRVHVHVQAHALHMYTALLRYCTCVIIPHTSIHSL